LSTRNLEEMMAERGVCVDHATVYRWALKVLPSLAKVFRRREESVGRSWRVDETYIPVAGKWKYLCRAADTEGLAVDFLLTAKRDLTAARRFFDSSDSVDLCSASIPATPQSDPLQASRPCML
jgi:transposase-like protein